MNAEIGTEAPIFLFWEYLFRNFGILSLQCGKVEFSVATCDNVTIMINLQNNPLPPQLASLFLSPTERSD
jgi:hypothetical protein